jgi:hypothetical protein
MVERVIVMESPSGDRYVNDRILSKSMRISAASQHVVNLPSLHSDAYHEYSFHDMRQRPPC